VARYPGAHWAPLREWTPSDVHTKDKFIVHTTGDPRDTPQSIYNWFNRADVVTESNFIIGKTAAEGVWQIMDSAAHADANVDANDSGISVECCGGGDEPLTDYQVGALVDLGIWARGAHPTIAARIIPTPTGSGFGWHVMFGAPGPWTTVNGKVCPGAPKIAQLKSTVFPAIFRGTPVQEDPFMALTDAEQKEMRDILRELRQVRPPYVGTPTGLAAAVGDIFVNARKAAKAEAPVDVATLAAAIVKLIPVSQGGMSKADLQGAIREVFADAGQE
jgi:hypothetical protein